MPRRPLLSSLMRWIYLSLALVVLAGCGGESETEGEASSVAEETLQVEEAPEWPVTTDPALTEGMAVFAEVCARCHLESEYAPTIADLKAWDRRLSARSEDGVAARDVFVTHATEGFGDMLAKGGKRGKDLTDVQVAQGVDFMLWAVEQHRADETP